MNFRGVNDKKTLSMGHQPITQRSLCQRGFFDLLRPTFMTLSGSKLLERCVRRATQYRNECDNSMVWAGCLMVLSWFLVLWPLPFVTFTVDLQAEWGWWRDSPFQLEYLQNRQQGTRQEAVEREIWPAGFCKEKKRRHDQGMQLPRTRREATLGEADGRNNDE